MIQLPRNIVNQILTHAQQSPEKEVCGLIGSLEGRPSHCYAVENVSREPERLFNMDPKGQIDTMRAMRERGGGVVCYLPYPSPYTSGALCYRY